DKLRHDDKLVRAFYIAARASTFEENAVSLVIGKRPDRHWRNDLRGALRHENRDVDATILQAPDDLRRLVARNSAADAESYLHSSCSSTSAGLSLVFSGILNLMSPCRISFCAICVDL